MQHSFGRVTPPQVPRSSFNRSCGHKTAIDADYLYPIFVDEVIPGDTFRMRATMFGRMATPIYPIMDNLYIDTFFFYVPYRLLWNNYHKFLGAQDDPGDSIDFTIPVIDTGTGGAAEDTIYDFMGIPDVDDVDISALPLRAYNLIWNEWFRDQNLQDSLDIDKTDGPDTTVYALQKRGKRHDYFTSSLPWPSKTDTQVTLPLGTSAPVLGIGSVNQTFDDASQLVYESDGTTTTFANASDVSLDADANEWYIQGTAATGGYPNIYADLSSATAATINAIRLAVTTQQFLERDARGGTRINEIIQSHFGVQVPDFRVQRPEYLGGSSTPINIHNVPQTSESNTTPQGTMSAYGTAFTNEPGFTKSFVEFGLIIGLVNIRADLTYQQGIERFWRKSTRYDFYWPEFANIGEQAVLQSEIFAANDAAGTNDDVWGYQERHAEYRYKPSRISSLFRSSHSATLDPWHLSEELSSPALDNTFIQSNTPMARVEAVSSQPDFILDCYFDLNCVRPMPMYATPGIARF
jgi:hypothetical protein